MSRRKPPGSPSGGQFAEEPRDADVHRSPDDELFDRTTRTLRDFLGFAEQGARLVARGRTAYANDEMLRLAAEALLHKIGEAVVRLERAAPDLITVHPEVNWRPMKGARNLVAHEYGAVDYEIVWTALETNLPQEAARLREILDDYTAKGSD